MVVLCHKRVADRDYVFLLDKYSDSFRPLALWEPHAESLFLCKPLALKSKLLKVHFETNMNLYKYAVKNKFHTSLSPLGLH